MISRIRLQNLAIFEDLEWNGLGSINIVIGENDTGKSHLLKLLYAVSRSLQEYSKRQTSDSPRWATVLAEKLKWTFQPPDFALGQLVRKGESKMRVDCCVHDEPVFFAFGDSTTKQINDTSATPNMPASTNTLFFPPKEVMTVRKAIITLREQLQINDGFGDTYYDLAKALGHSMSRGRYQDNLSNVLEQLEDLFDGHIEEEDDEFVFKKGQGPKKFSMSQTAEGVKKIGVLTQLIRNRNIQDGSILFFDEPAAHLHPSAAMAFVEMLFEMAKANIQIFIATHSYVVLKQFELLAREHKERVPLCLLASDSENGVNATFADLQDRIPANSIVDASMELFNQDLALSSK